MKFYHFGDKSSPDILLLETDFHVACVAYGCSLGGSFVGLLVQRKKIHIDHAILDSSELDQDPSWKVKLKCVIAIPLLHKIVSTGEYPKALQGSNHSLQGYAA